MSCHTCTGRSRGIRFALFLFRFIPLLSRSASFPLTETLTHHTRYLLRNENVSFYFPFQTTKTYFLTLLIHYNLVALKKTLINQRFIMAGDLGIHLESTKAVAGSVIKGCVYMDVKGSTQVDDISLRLVGEESTKVQYIVEVDVPGTAGGDSVPENERQTRDEYGKRNLINLQLPIDNSSLQQDGIIPIGRYKLPFEVELPAVLLPSLYETGNQGYCKVAYKLHVELKKASRGIFSSTTLKAEQDIEIRAKPLDDDPIPYNAPPVTESVSFCCCINKGQMHFGAKVKDTRLDRGETTTISMSCRNESTASIDTIQATLHQQLSWKAGTHSESKSNVLAHSTFDTFQDEQEFASSNAADPEQATRDIIFREVESGVHSGQVAMPMTANLSMKGSLMSCVHYITSESATFHW
jgi:hypothetical protein